MKEQYSSIYGGFCKDKECRVHGLLTKLDLFENPSPLVRRQKELLKEKCKDNCEHTAYEFYQWALRR